jgi:hypothetical protein
MSAAIEEAVQQVRKVDSGIREFFDTINWFLQRVPEPLEYLIQPIVNGMRRLDGKYSDFRNELNGFMLTPGDYAKLESYFEVLVNEVAKPLNTIAGDIAMDKLETSTEWTGSGAEAYKAVVPAQGDGLKDVADLATELGNTLKELSNGIEDFWIAIGFAVAALVVGIAAALAEAATVVGAPPAIVTVIAALGIALAFITTAVIELKSIYDTLDTGLDSISQEIDKVGDEWAKATPQNQAKIDNPRQWRPIDDFPSGPQVGPQLGPQVGAQGTGQGAGPQVRPPAPAVPDPSNSTNSPNPADAAVRPQAVVLPKLNNPVIPPVVTASPKQPGPSIPGLGTDAMSDVPPPPPPPPPPPARRPRADITDPSSATPRPEPLGSGPVRPDPSIGTVPSGSTSVSSILNPAPSAGGGGTPGIGSPDPSGGGNRLGTPPQIAGPTGGGIPSRPAGVGDPPRRPGGNVGGPAPTSPAGSGGGSVSGPAGPARPAGLGGGPGAGTATGAQSPGPVPGGAAAPGSAAASGGPAAGRQGQFGGIPIAGGLAAGQGSEDATRTSKYRIQGNLFDDPDQASSFDGIVGTDPANRPKR